MGAIMMVFCPAAPRRNAARSVTPSTRHVMVTELSLAAKQLSGTLGSVERLWAEPTLPACERIIFAACPNAPEGDRSYARWLHHRALPLVLVAEKLSRGLGDVQLRPLPGLRVAGVMGPCVVIGVCGPWVP